MKPCEIETRHLAQIWLSSSHSNRWVLGFFEFSCCAVFEALGSFWSLFSRTSLVTILNHYGPRSEDAWMASLLMQALKDLLPAMFGAELGFLVPLRRSENRPTVGSPTNQKASIGNVSPILHRGFRYKHVKTTDSSCWRWFSQKASRISVL